MPENLDSLSDRPESALLRYVASDGDVFASVLETVRLASRVFCRSQLSAPWAMTLRAGDFAHFHVVERGGAWLRLEGSPDAVALAGGDLVIVPHGHGHTLASAESAIAVPLDSIPREQVGGHYVLRHGGGGAETQMICGAFEFDRSMDNPLLGILPEVVHVHSGQAGEWLEPLLRLLAAEARRPSPGSSAVVARLGDIIFVQAVRVWLASQPEGAGGWLGALRDKRIGAALASIHREPARSWSVRSLAEVAGMSRSPFAARFREYVGEPPLSYLARWRMQLVAASMRDGRLNLRQMAEQAGYESEAAFSKAFKRHLGVSPSEYRRNATFRDEFPAELRTTPEGAGLNSP